MRWIADVSAGDWIRERLAPEPWDGSMHVVVPRGFASYARIFHPPSVSWVEGRAFPTQDELRESDPSSWPETFSAPTTWREVAHTFGTEWHGGAQWNRIARAAPAVDANGLPQAGDWQNAIGPDGRQYSAPQEGSLDRAQLAAVAGHLSRETSTPAEIWIAIWEGWGHVVGSFGPPSTPAVSTLTAVDPEEFARHAEMIGRSIRDPFNNVFRKPVWRPGLLDDDISRGGRFSLPNRDHVLFTGDIAELADPEWAARVPWAESESAWTQSPSLIWPADHAWVLVTEVDYDSTIVGGDTQLIRALCADPTIEALPIREGTHLTWDADEANR